LSLVAFCTDVSRGWPVSVSSYTVVIIYESWTYLIKQRFLALIAFLCWCAVKQSINQCRPIRLSTRYCFMYNDAFAISTVQVPQPFNTSYHCSASFNHNFINYQLCCGTASYTWYNFNDVDWNATNNCWAVVDWSCLFNTCACIDDFNNAVYGYLELLKSST